MAVFANQPNGAGTDTLELRILLQDMEYLQQRERPLLEDARVGDLEIAAAALKAFADGLWRSDLIVQQDRLLEQLHQHLVEPIQLHHGAIILLHELLDGQVVAVVRKAEFVRQRALVVEQQPVFAAAGEAVQGEADAPEQ